jgi:carboxymethylenebutenolidase
MTEKSQTKLIQLKPEQIPQQAFDWYDEYAHGDIHRRTFITSLGNL